MNDLQFGKAILKEPAMSLLLLKYLTIKSTLLSKIWILKSGQTAKLIQGL